MPPSFPNVQVPTSRRRFFSGAATVGAAAAVDISLDFTAAAPLTYDHSTGGGAYDNRTVGRAKDIVESLEARVDQIPTGWKALLRGEIRQIHVAEAKNWAEKIKAGLTVTVLADGDEHGRAPAQSCAFPWHRPRRGLGRPRGRDTRRR